MKMNGRAMRQGPISETETHGTYKIIALNNNYTRSKINEIRRQRTYDKQVQPSTPKRVYSKVVYFSSKVIIIHSEQNSTGKTTLLRAILFALGFLLPNTELIRLRTMNSR